MSRSTVTGLALALFVLGSLGCEKNPPDAEAPTVIVDEPEPTPPEQAPGETGAAPNEPHDPSEPKEIEGDSGTIETVASEVPCESDADCVKSTCCHATSCVALADAPDCSDTMCTLECRAGSMDCYGGCVCQAGFCAAQLWSPRL